MAHDRAAALAGVTRDSIDICMRYDPGVSPLRGRSQGHAFGWEARPIGSMANPWGTEGRGRVRLWTRST
jgi:hypothetical protein